MRGILRLVVLSQSFWFWSVIYRDMIVKMKGFSQSDIFYADRYPEKQHASAEHQ